MLKSQISPEACYEFIELSRKDVIKAYKKRITITGYVKKVDKENEQLIVYLGKGLNAILPFSEVTIYPFTYSKSNSFLPVQINTIIERTIRVKVTNISGDTITVSRKKNMQFAYKHLSKCSELQFYVTNLTTTLVFGDVGDGINGRISIQDICRSRIRNVSEILHLNDNIWVSVLDKDDSYRFILSYKDIFPKYDPNNYHRGDSVIGITGDPVDKKHSGYYIYINPQVYGIMDVEPWTPIFNYGDKIECKVAKATTKGVKLRYSRHLNKK